jgi:23S rRNA pseudouridine2605 synthase
MRVRIQKVMAQAGVGSRRACEDMIRQERVTVNGQVAPLGQQIDPSVDQVRVDGKPLPQPEPPMYVAVNKPPGMISDKDVSGERPTVRDLVPLGGHLYPVGRLDIDSEGLILLTNDGELAHRLAHPRYQHSKTYRVLVEGHPDAGTLAAWRGGVMLDGRRTAPAKVKVLQRQDDATWLQIELREGRKRQIRRVATSLGHPVRQLIRTHIGTLALDDLEPGQWRRLSDDEVRELRAWAGLGRVARRRRGASRAGGRSARQPRTPETG